MIMIVMNFHICAAIRNYKIKNYFFFTYFLPGYSSNIILQSENLLLTQLYCMKWHEVIKTYKLKDILKALKNFKNKQRSVCSNAFWYVKV